MLPLLVLIRGLLFCIPVVLLDCTVWATESGDQATANHAQAIGDGTQASQISARQSGDEAPDPEEQSFWSAERLRAAGFHPLFEGTDLQQWQLEKGHEGHWTIRNGVLHYDGKAEQKKSFDKSLWTREAFADLELYVEWRLSADPIIKEHPIVLWNGDFLRDGDGNRITRPHLDAGDSGIYFRGHFPCQANIWSQDLGSGEINGYRTNRKLPVRLRQSCLPFENADRPLGQWNAFRIRLKNNRMTVNLNGRLVLESGALPDLPARGPIGLQHHGDPIEFRNIWVKELSANE